MAQLLVRNVPDYVVEALRERARSHGRSVEAEHRAVLESLLRPEGTTFAQRAADLRRATRGRIKTDAADLIRQNRDAR